MRPRPDGSHALLFDLDGVLVDSRVAITTCINHALTQHDLPRRPPESLHRYIGPPLATAFADMTGAAPDSPLVSSCVESYRSRYGPASLRDTTVMPGVADVVASLAGHLRLAVATSKPLAFADPLLEALGLRSYFTTVAGPDLSAEREDKAQTIAAALAALGAPERAVMVGDRSFDVLGARVHGLPSIGVTWGIGDRAELEAAGADVIIDEPSELPDAATRLLEKKAGPTPKRRPGSEST